LELVFSMWYIATIFKRTILWLKNLFFDPDLGHTEFTHR